MIPASYPYTQCNACPPNKQCGWCRLTDLRYHLKIQAR